MGKYIGLFEISYFAFLTPLLKILKSILTDDANNEIPSNMTMHVAPPGGQISH